MIPIDTDPRCFPEAEVWHGFDAGGTRGAFGPLSGSRHSGHSGHGGMGDEGGTIPGNDSAEAATTSCSAPSASWAEGPRTTRCSSERHHDVSINGLPQKNGWLNRKKNKLNIIESRATPMT